MTMPKEFPENFLMMQLSELFPIVMVGGKVTIPLAFLNSYLHLSCLDCSSLPKNKAMNRKNEKIMHECYYGIVAVNAHCRHRRSSLNPFSLRESSGKKQKKILSLPFAARKKLHSHRVSMQIRIISFRFSPERWLWSFCLCVFSFLLRKIISRERRKIKNPDWWEFFWSSSSLGCAFLVSHPFS